MIRTVSPWVVAAALVAATACGSKNTSTNVTQPSGPKATSITLNVLPSLKIGNTTKAVATVKFDDGSTSTSAATITSDATAIASIAADGTVSGLKSGTTNITATAQTLVVTQNVRVFPDVNGLWNGTVIQTACTSSSGLTCGPNGTTTAFSINVGQNDTTVPTAFVLINGATITTSGTIAVDGTLTLAGQSPFSDPGFDTLKVQNWATTYPTPKTMTGSFQIAALKNGAQVIILSLTIQSATQQ